MVPPPDRRGVPTLRRSVVSLCCAALGAVAYVHGGPLVDRTVSNRRRLFTSSVSRSGSAYQAFRQTRFFSSLDGLRAISIAAVVWHHTAAYATTWTWSIFRAGNQGVHLFFVISAFLITTLLLRAKDAGSLDLPRFWMRRAVRILPLYYAVLGIYVVAVFAFERDALARGTFFANLPAFLTFTSNWFVDLEHGRVIFYFAWSLAAEEQFYLCWPWVERWASSWKPVSIAVATLVVTQVAGAIDAASEMARLPLKIVGSVPPTILTGVILAHVLHRPNTYRWAYVVLGRRGSAVGAATLAVLAVSIGSRLPGWSGLVVAVAFALLVGSCVVRQDNDLAPILRVRWIAWIGTTSYGIYLVHMLCANVVQRALGDFLHVDSSVATFVGTLVLSTLVASLSYCTYEAYFRGVKRRWSGTSSAADANTPVSAVPAKVS